MIDLHTHILPGIDDGAPDIKIALQMLSAEAKQGVETVALTPHFYRNREHISVFLKRRADAMDHLNNALKDISHPKLILSAEVAYMPGISDWSELDQLCYQGTRLLLIEPPMSPWNEEMFNQLYALEVRRGITPMIAHIDRYLSIQPKDRIEQLLETGLPIQISAGALANFFERSRAIKYLNDYGAIPVTDCHNVTTRPPNLKEAAQILEKKLGAKAQKILQRANDFHQW